MDSKIKQKLDIFFAKYPLTTFDPAHDIIQPGETIDHVYYLIDGYVKQHLYTDTGEEMTFHIFKPASYFPIILGMRNEINRYTFTTICTIKARKAPIAEVLTFIKQEPDVLYDLTLRLGDGISGLLLKIENTLHKDAYRKVAYLLYYLAERFAEKRGNDTYITLPLTHADMASWLGIQRETVSRQLEKLRSEKIIFTEKNHFLITDLEKLKALF